MNKEIKYTGHTAVPSDYECPDGTLAAALNLWPENGSLKPVMQPELIGNVGSGKEPLYIHKTASYEHCIVHRTNGKFEYGTIDSHGLSQLSDLSSPNDFSINNADLYEVQSLGNTLMFLTSSGIRYFVWNGTNYTDLSYGLPGIDLSFGLKQSRYVIGEQFTVTLATAVDTSQTQQFSNANADAISDTVISHINKFIADNSTGAGKFMFPFFVRYGLRMHDGTVAMLSAPILMLPATGPVPLVVYHAATLITQSSLGLDVEGWTYDLDYAVKNSTQISRLRKYSDIVRSVDIFISNPIYKYDQNGKCTGMQSAMPAGVAVSKNNSGQYSREPYTYGNGDPHAMEGERYINIPTFDDDAVRASVIGASSFFLLKSIPIASLVAVRTKIDIASDYLSSLLNREALVDTYDEHDRLIPKTGFVYNSRLNLTAITKRLFGGFSPSQFAYNSSSGEEGEAPADVKCYVYISTDSGQDIIVESEDFPVGQDFGSGYYFYYPNRRAYKAVLADNEGGVEIYLQEHPYLNGAFFFGDWQGAWDIGRSVTVPQRVEGPLNVTGKIYTSDINNPFVFPVVDINSVGTGEVIGLSTAARALSQGQFGQFPLYAFTTDGIWALEVDKSTGAFSARQPISRDVCTSAKSITQLDGSVLFATERGIMEISGSNVECITDAIDNLSDNLLDFANLPQLYTICGSLPEIISFHEFLPGCGILYDYTSQRIIIFNPNRPYAYVFSIRGKAWAFIRTQITTALNSFPRAWATNDAGDIYDYSKRVANSTPAAQLMVTRPLKLDAPDALKTIRSIIQRGVFAPGQPRSAGHVQTMLYGARELNSGWEPVASSVNHYLRGISGTPYKYFVIALKCSLTDDESLSGCSVDYEIKESNQLR